MKPTPLDVRFWRRVVKTETCWIWTASKDCHGYGRLRTITTSKGFGGRAHRVSWELHYGPIPDSLLVLHRCDNPPCVRPDHLFLGTRSDNVHDMALKGRHGMAKLTINDVKRIKALRNEHTQAAVAAMFGVSREAVAQIDTRKNWAHVV